MTRPSICVGDPRDHGGFGVGAAQGLGADERAQARCEDVIARTVRRIAAHERAATTG